MQLGTFIFQPEGYRAYIPKPFPPQEGLYLSTKLIQKATMATLSLGKLDGISQLLPDVDFFLFMYICKDAASSSQIEGTRATMIDAIEATAQISNNLPEDVDDILHYIEALNYGINRLQELPLSLRLIKEIHKELMSGARTSHFADPGNFRTSQNWIGGTSLKNALFVPPPAHEMERALGDLEMFFHMEDELLPVLKAGLIHGQFEAIHPFLDGNGRTGRMLITLTLCLTKLLERPVLFLSSYFKRHQKIYYERLEGYHSGQVEEWLDFFLDGIIEMSQEAIQTAKKINELRESDMKKIQTLGKTASASGIEILTQLFKLPVVNVAIVEEWTGFTRQGADKVIKRFIDLGILEPKDETVTYGRTFIYRKYVEIFRD